MEVKINERGTVRVVGARCGLESHECREKVGVSFEEKEILHRKHSGGGSRKGLVGWVSDQQSETEKSVSQVIMDVVYRDMV